MRFEAFDYKKATQALNFFAISAANQEIGKLKALKLYWAADRYHLRKYGRPIVRDEYWAMQFGPVASSVKDLTETSAFLSDEERAYRDKYLQTIAPYKVRSISPCDNDVFSESDIEALDFAQEKLGGKLDLVLSAFSHDFPEWARHKPILDSGVSRVSMQLADFFCDKGGDEDIFIMDRSELDAAREIFEEDAANYVEAFS